VAYSFIGSGPFGAPDVSDALRQLKGCGRRGQGTRDSRAGIGVRAKHDERAVRMPRRRQCIDIRQWARSDGNFPEPCQSNLHTVKITPRSQCRGGPIHLVAEFITIPQQVRSDGGDRGVAKRYVRATTGFSASCAHLRDFRAGDSAPETGIADGLADAEPCT